MTTLAMATANIDKSVGLVLAAVCAVFLLAYYAKPVACASDAASTHGLLPGSTAWSPKDSSAWRPKTSATTPTRP